MFRRCFVTASFALLLSLVAPLAALALCFLEDQVPARSASHSPGFTSCLDDEESPFLPQVYQGRGKIYFPKAEKGAPNAHYIDLFQEPPVYRALGWGSGTAVVPLSVPIYQLNAVYRI